MAEIGEQLSSITVAAARFVVATSDDGVQSRADVDELLALLTTEQRLSVFDLTPLQIAISGIQEYETLATQVA